ncbi:MAG: TonB-dependent receptor [Bacteroidaceae bacterium]|nr:TonB-dependent receptor [Bacteroidaceae bacterium]
MKMHKVFVLLSTLLIPLLMMAQGTGTISGKIIDSKTKEPLSFVTVSLTPQGSSTPIYGVNTDDDGLFKIAKIKTGNYTARFSFVGYLDDTRNIEIGISENVEIGTIRLKPDNKLLKEVVVTEQRSQMSFEIDRRVFTVDQNIATTGGSASDVLEDIPSVEVDTEGKVSLRGSESVTVWINGKASGLTSDNQGDILQQMPAGSIEKIEVITNPSAKHSPEGTAGIINIVLKRDRKAGYYGSVQAGADSQGGYNAGGNINYSSGKLDAYANVNYRHMNHEGEGNSFTRYYNHNRYQRQRSNNSREPQNLFARAGVTWRFTEKDEIYANIMGMKTRGDMSNNTTTLSGSLEQMDTTEMIVRTTDAVNRPKMFNIEGGYRHTFKDGHYIDLSVNHNIWGMDNEAVYRQNTERADNIYKSYQFQNNEVDNRSTSIKLEYENKISENTRIEAGYNGTLSRDENPTITYTDEAHTQVDKNMFNRFIYNQDTHAIYGTYSGRLGKFGYQLGLRGEYWRVKTRSFNWEQEQNPEQRPSYIKKDFFSLFPSLFISYSLPNGHELQVNYTRRLRRPWGGQLNSFSNISDSTNISFGNPDLTPEYSNAYELNYIKNWKEHTLSISGYFRTTDDVIERISYSDPTKNIMYTTFENVASEKSAGLEIIGKNRLFKKLDLTTTLNLFYYKLDGFRYTINNQEITGEADENFSWNARMTASMILPWGITMQATGRYNAKRVVAQGHREPNYSFDCGLRKSFNKHWSISMNIRDILDSRGWHTITGDRNFYRDSENRHGGRRFGMTLTYSFGNMKAKRPTRKPSQNQNMNMESDGYGDEGMM